MKRGSLTHEAVDGIAWQSFAIGANVALRTLILIILTRSLLPKDFGIIAAAMVVISVTTVLSEIGVARVLVQRPSLTPGIEKSAFAISLYMGVTASVLIYLSAPWTGRLFGMEELVPYVEFLSIVLLVNGISIIAQAMTQRARKFKAMGLIELGAFLVGFGCVALPLAQLGYGAWSLAYGYLVQSVIKLIAFCIVTPPQIGFVPREGTRELLFTGTAFMAGQAGNFVARQVDYLIVGRVLGAVPLGFYNRAYQFLMLPAQLFGTATAKVLFPSIASIQDDPERIARAFTRALGIIAMLTLPASGFLTIIAPELVLTLFGETWSGMIVPFQILILSLLFRTSYKISDSVSLALGSMRQRAWRQWVYAAAAAIGTFVGAQWGLAGVAVGVCAAVIVNFLIMTALAISITQVRAPDVFAIHIRHFLIAVVYSLVILAVVSAMRALGWSDPAILAIGTVVAMLEAAILWFVFRRAFGEDGMWLEQLIHSRFSAVGKKLAFHAGEARGARESDLSEATAPPSKRPKTTIDIKEAEEQSREVGRQLASLDTKPDFAVGLANGGILPALVAAETASLHCEIIKVRRKGSKLKQRFRALRKVIRLFPGLMRFGPIKRMKRSFDRAFDQVEVNDPNEVKLDVVGRHVVIIDDCIDSGSTVALIRERLLKRGAATVSTAVISWGTKYDSQKLHQVVPDVALGRTIDIYPWALESPHYDEFLQWLEKRGLKVWV